MFCFGKILGSNRNTSIFFFFLQLKTTAHSFGRGNNVTALAHVLRHVPLALAGALALANASAQATKGSQVTPGKSGDFLAPTALIFLRSQCWLPFLLFFSFFLSFRFSVNRNINSAQPDSFCASHNIQQLLFLKFEYCFRIRFSKYFFSK